MQDVTRQVRVNSASQVRVSETIAAAPATVAGSCTSVVSTTGHASQDGPSSAQSPEVGINTESNPTEEEFRKVETSVSMKNQADTAGSTPSAIFSGISDKAKRTELHTFFRNDLDLPRLVTDTVKGPDGCANIRVMAQADLKASVRKCASHPAGSPPAAFPLTALSHGSIAICGSSSIDLA